MSAERNESMRGELLEYLYGCHAEPERIERELKSDPELRALLDEVRAAKSVLDRAAQGEVGELRLETPRENAPSARRPLARLALAAGFLLALLAGAPWAWVFAQNGRLQGLEDQYLRLVVSGPTGVPDGAPAHFRVETWDLDGGSSATQVSWSALDEEGQVLDQGQADSRGALDVDLPANLAGLRRVEVEAQRGDVIRTASLEMAPGREAPLAHLSSDKPAYRPGETAFLRAVVLDRLSLASREGTCRLRVIDPKGAAVETWYETLEEGVASRGWTVPEDAAGGEYTFEIRDAGDAFSVERLPLLVRRYQAPRLAKRVDLDKETYAPGAEGVAELSVERAEGGAAAGAAVEATLVIDGAEVWREAGTLDRNGNALFVFRVPPAVERGEARFVARVTDGGVVETAVEPFVVPTGSLTAHLYPEGGELIAGVTGRVYAEVLDSLDRPTSARGRVVDARGRTVARLETLHQGRGRFDLTPVAGERYRLEFDEPQGDAVDLPAVIEGGVALRSDADAFPSGANVGARVITPGPGPWIAAVFCRGALVAQDTFVGEGEHNLSLPIADGIAGVLRMTVFDSGLRPVAERLVVRESGRAITVSVRPWEETLLPGEHQVLDIETRDELGRPVSAVLGMAVSDRAVRDMLGETRVGLADQTWLLGDVEELEQVEDFLTHDAEGRRNVDLLLGTRGWRRFAWLDPAASVAEHGEAAQRLVLREGRSQMPQVSDVRGSVPGSIHKTRSELRRSRQRALALGALALLLTALWGLGWLMAKMPATRAHPILAGSVSFVLLLAVGWQLIEGQVPDSIVAGIAFDAEVPAAEAGAEIARGAILVDEYIQDFDVQVAQAAGLADPILWFGARFDGEDAPGAFFDDGAEGDFRGRAEQFFERPDAARNIIDRMAMFDEQNNNFFPERESSNRVRVYAHKHAASASGVRDDFTETVYWHALLKTSADGTARVEFDLSDRVTTWHVAIDAHGSGRVGQALEGFEALTPFHLEAKLPQELSEGDRIDLPVALTSGASAVSMARVAAAVSGPLQVVGEIPEEIALEGGRGRLLVPVQVTGSGEGARIGLVGSANGWVDRVGRDLRVVPRGFPHRVSKSGKVTEGTEFSLAMPDGHVEGSLDISLVLYPSPLAGLFEGVEGIMQEPYGCFEQASTANYPNVLAMAYMQAAGIEAPALANRARGLMERGYAKLVGYECSERGYEWFGGNPGHEALTAYGLLEFTEMATVFDVDQEMLDRTRAWLLERRTGKGDYERNDRALDSFGAAAQTVTDAYLTYSLLLTGQAPVDLGPEIDLLAKRAVESDDPYEVALAAAALEAAGRTKPADAARDRLKLMQGDDGSLTGTVGSITRSGGRDLAVETTSLALMAWLADDEDGAAVERALEFLLASRRGNGTFGATQATIQALRALTAYAGAHRSIANAGELVVMVNDFEVARIPFEAGQRGKLEVPGLVEHLSPGNNRVRLALTGGNEFPWALDMDYFAEVPADDPDCSVGLETALAEESVEEGRTVALTARIENRTDEGLPMTLAVIGLPAGLEARKSVLDDLREAGRFDLWELNGREVVLYWRALGPREVKEVVLDLVARIPGETTGPASRAYLYYTPDSKRWNEPIGVEVSVAR